MNSCSLQSSFKISDKVSSFSFTSSLSVVSVSVAVSVAFVSYSAAYGSLSAVDLSSASPNGYSSVPIAVI
jgi:hypothetical protein